MVVLNHNLLRLARIQIARCGTKTDYSDGLLEISLLKSSCSDTVFNAPHANVIRKHPIWSRRSSQRDRYY